jgi:hypothetical protein
MEKKKKSGAKPPVEKETTYIKPGTTATPASKPTTKKTSKRKVETTYTRISRKIPTTTTNKEGETVKGYDGKPLKGYYQVMTKLTVKQKPKSHRGGR